MKRRSTDSRTRTLRLLTIVSRGRVVLRTLPPLVICACLVLSLAGQNNRNQELQNFHEVNSQLYRGAQPKSGGIKRLAQLGIKTIVNLRKADGLGGKEETEARAAGMRYFNIPFREWGRPTDEQVNRVLAILNNPENQPVFVHCRLGSDRTGLVIATYRISHDGWTSERARAEANKYGLHPWEVGMKHYIRDYERRQKARARLMHTPGLESEETLMSLLFMARWASQNEMLSEFSRQSL